MIDEYIARDAERANVSACKFNLNRCNTLSIDSSSVANAIVVYDSIEASPHYDNTINDLYIDERELIELPPVNSTGEGTINEPYQKKYYFNPNNLPYSLEQPHSYSSHVRPVGEKNSGTVEKKGPRLNRYYENLKPYYKLKEGAPDNTLIFESRFESGNLRKAVKVDEYEYDLFL